MLVSIIITAYNVEKYIRECLDSVLTQDYEPREILIVDDGSEDGTAALCKEYLERVPGLQYIYQENSGVSVARNRGIEWAQGEFLMFVDGDDRLAPGSISALVAKAVSQVDVVCCGYAAFQENWKESHGFFQGDRQWRTAQEKEQLYLQLMQMHYDQPGEVVYTGIGVPWGKLYRTASLREKGLLFLPALRRMQDNIFNMYAFAELGTVVYVDAPLYEYRLDHITGSKLPYSPEIYCNVLRQRELFGEKYNPMVTQRMRDFYRTEKMDFLLRCIKHVAMTRDRKEAVADIRYLCEGELYRDFLRQKSPKGEPLKYRMVRTLAACKAYGCMDSYYKLKNKRNS